MENTSSPTPDQTAEISPPNRRSIRIRLLWIVTACSLFAMVIVFAWMQFTSRALAKAQAQATESRRQLPQNPMGRPNEVKYGQFQSSVNPVNRPTANSAPFNSLNTGGWQPYPSPDVSYQLAQYYQPIPSQSSPFENNSEESRIQQLALHYRTAESGKKESISQALTHFLTELFDARHKAQSSRVEALKNEVQQTQELLDKRLQNKSKIIERRVKELTGQQDELSWNASVPVANPSSTLAENRPIQTPIQNPAYYAPANNMVPFAGTPYPTPSNSSPPTTPSGSLPSPFAIPPTSPAFDNLPSEMFPPTGFAADKLPSSNSLPTTVPVISNPVNNDPITGPLESQRSFMNIGFKIKGLMRQLEGEQSIKGATKVKSEIEETEAVWEFEKSRLKTELELAESEYELVMKQLDQASEQVGIQKVRVNADGTADAKLNCSKAEVAKSEVERQLLQLRSRMTTLKKSIDWMEDFFKEKPTSPPSSVAEPEALPPAY